MSTNPHSHYHYVMISIELPVFDGLVPVLGQTVKQLIPYHPN